jgi:hypothetical protein
MRGGLLLVAAVLAALAASSAYGDPAAAKGACRLLYADDLRTAFGDPATPVYGRPGPNPPIRQIPGQRRFHGTEHDCTFFGEGGAQVDIFLSALTTRVEASRYYRQSTGRFCAKRDRLSFGPIGCRTDGTAGHIVAASGRFQLEIDGSKHDRSAMSVATLETLAKDVFATAPRYY